MNLAGATPFLFHLWLNGHNMDTALTLISAPLTIVVIYGAAAIGYMVNWALSGIVSTVIVQRSHIRLEDIDKRQKELVVRWGEEVSGEVPLGQDGFPLHQSKKKKEDESDQD